jgi:hypothetical protein
MEMTIGAAIRQGLGLARRTRSVVWVLFLANLGLALLAGLPIYRGILSFTGHSLMSRSLLYGFSTDWLVDFSVNSPRSLNRYAEMIALFGLLSIPVNTILAGGILGRLRRGAELPFSLGDFCRDSSHYAWRLLRLMIMGLICYWLVFRVLHQSLGELVNKWTSDASDDRVVFWAHLGVTALVLIGLVFVNLVMDYARVKLVMEESASAVEAFLAALGFSLGRLGKALAVYAIPSLCGIALLGIYRLVIPWHLVDTQLAGVSPGAYREPLTLALLFIVQQLIMFGRYWFRVATWASEWSYYSGCR